MAPLNRLILLAGLCACACAQYAEERVPRYIPSASEKVAPTPVPILKQINKHNEDGSYTYGYEAADGSFKIETKGPTGDVKGKYGYKDDTGKLRVVEYGANKYGFQPAGEGITVAPPTLVDESKEESRPSKSQGRSQYRPSAPAPAQSIDYDYEEPAAPPAPRPAPRPAVRQQLLSSQGPTPPKPTFFAGAAPVPDQGSLFRPAPPAPAPSPRRTQVLRPNNNFQAYSNPKPQIEYTQQYSSEPAQPQYSAPVQEPRYQQYQEPQQFSQGNQQFSQGNQQFSQGNQPFSQGNPHFTQDNRQSSQGNRPFSMLDQLLKEYALPQGGAAPLHDITFGTY